MSRATSSVMPRDGKRLHHVAVGLAGGDDAQARARRVPDDAVQAVGAAVGEGGVDLVVEQARLLLEDAVGPADVEPAAGQDEVLGDLALTLSGSINDRSAGFDHVGDALERDPAARIAAHREAVQAEVEVVLHVRRVEVRDQAGLEDVLGLVRQRRGLGGMVVAGQHQHAAVLRGAGGVGVLEHVAAAVDARAPCRTTWRTRRRSWRPGTCRPAACPRSRWRRGPRSRRAGT